MLGVDFSGTFLCFENFYGLAILDVFCIFFVCTFVRSNMIKGENIIDYGGRGSPYICV